MLSHCFVILKCEGPGPKEEILCRDIAEFIIGKHQQIPERKQDRKAEERKKQIIEEIEGSASCTLMDAGTLAFLLRLSHRSTSLPNSIFFTADHFDQAVGGQNQCEGNDVLE